MGGINVDNIISCLFYLISYYILTYGANMLLLSRLYISNVFVS